MSIKFHMPDFTVNGPLNLIFFDFIKRKPEYFREGVEIASVYGCFPPAIWNGGRCVSGLPAEAAIVRYINEFNSRKIPLRYTFTNPNVREEHLSDKFCNRITELAHNGLNEIIVNVPILEEYIRKNYPKYPIISSTVKQIEDMDALKAELEKDYKLVVLDYNWNNDFERLEKIPHKERCEILINPYCTPNCKRRGEHYKFLGNIQMNKAATTNSDVVAVEMAKFHCPYMQYNFYQAAKFRTHVNADDLYTRYVEMGFSNFKIEGRMIHPFNILESYVYYFAKPECKDIVRMEMLFLLGGQQAPSAARAR